MWYVNYTLLKIIKFLKDKKKCQAKHVTLLLTTLQIPSHNLRRPTWPYHSPWSHHRHSLPSSSCSRHWAWLILTSGPSYLLFTLLGTLLFPQIPMWLAPGFKQVSAHMTPTQRDLSPQNLNISLYPPTLPSPSPGFILVTGLITLCKFIIDRLTLPLVSKFDKNRDFVLFAPLPSGT